MNRFILKFFSLLLLISIFRVPLSNANYLDRETSLENTFAAGCWAPPSAPALASPADNSFINSASLTLDWDDSSFVCPGETLTYVISINGGETEASLSELVFTPTVEDVYLWKVKAKDSQGRESDWTTVWQITVDRTPPTTALSFNGALINEKVLNGGFESGLTDWQTIGTAVVQGVDSFTGPYNGSKMARIGHKTAVTGNEIWENRLRQRIQPGAKNLSFWYNFFSFDVDPFDDPGMIVRLNDHNVFYLSAAEIDSGGSPNSSGWTQLSFDISQISDPILEIVFYSGNTDPVKTNQSWVYIDNISTAEAVVDDATDFILAADEIAQTYYSLDGGLTWINGNAFNSTGINGSATALYYSVDLAGNTESYNSRRIVKDIEAPVAVSDLTATALSKQSVHLSWIAPDSVTVYDIRYSQEAITESNFNAAMPLPNPPAPRRGGELQEWEIGGLNADTLYYFALKSGDAALNWSLVSNNSSAETLDDVIEDPAVNPGDVVINELMWMGTSRGSGDEYLELRNMTDREIDLSNWTVAGVTIPVGKKLSAQSYFLISNFNQSNSKINVTPDVVNTSLNLPDTNTQYLLVSSWGEIIDTADNGLGAPAAGAHSDTLGRHWSMERDTNPGNGRNADVWHTCLDDSVLMHSYWDSGLAEKGTPGRENLSQTAVTELQLNYSDNRFNFTVINTSMFNALEYTLIYDSDLGSQGIIGKAEIKNENIIEVKDLISGSCSSGGSCTYHEGIKNIKLEVKLFGLIERVLIKTL